MATDYAALNWSSGTTLSGKNMDHMEGMVDNIDSHISEHTHPTIHYSETQSDAISFHAGDSLIMDADMVDGMHAADLIGGTVPVGIMTLYSGADSDFASGYLNKDTRWHICDGGTYNGTVTLDMRNNFPKCPNLWNTSGTGGQALLITTGTITVSGTTLTSLQIPIHTHNWPDTYTVEGVILPNTYRFLGHTAADQTSIGPRLDNNGLTSDSNNAGATAAHDHGSIVTGLNAVSLTSKWKSYYFIMKVS